MDTGPLEAVSVLFSMETKPVLLQRVKWGRAGTFTLVLVLFLGLEALVISLFAVTPP